MLRNVSSLGILILLGAWAPSGAAQVWRDVIVTGPQRYVRTEQLGYSYPVGSVVWVSISAANGICAFSGTYASGFFVSLTHFDRWAQRIHDSVNVDALKGFEGNATHGFTDGTNTCVVWWSLEGEFRARVMDTQGHAVSDTFPVNAFPPFRWYDTGAFSSDKMGVVLKETIGNYQHGDLYLRLFTREGQPLTEPVPLANTPEQSEEGSVLAPLPDGSAVMGFVRAVRPYGQSYVYLLKINPDLSFGQPVRVSEEPANKIYVRALRDGTLFVWYRGARASVRRFSRDLEPLGPAVEADQELFFVAAADDGRFAVADRIYTGGNPPDDAWVRLFDQSWKPLGPKLKIAMPGGRPITTMVQILHPVTYDDDGTVWLAWHAYGGWPGSEPVL